MGKGRARIWQGRGKGVAREKKDKGGVSAEIKDGIGIYQAVANVGAI
jgi:hypothetical protein